MKHNKQANDCLKLKVRLYFISLWLLFLLACFLTANFSIIFWDKHISCEGIINFAKCNWLSILFFILTIIDFILVKITNYDFKGATYPPYKVEEITNESYEHLTFLTTYIIPLICITLDQIKFVIVLFFLLIVIGVIFIKMDLYFGNPTLALLGYRLFKIQLKDFDDVNEIIIISRDKLSKGSSFKWIPITDNVWLAKEI